MSNNIKIILVIVFGIVALYIFKLNSDYNLNKSISACIVAQKKSSKEFDPEKALDNCKKHIMKNSTNAE
tara:strand:- start:391 stop:597 length:207 start_codon:yes stop_codon:yes gene_type:complete